MPSLIQGFEYDIFVSYRQKDNRYDHWVTEFVMNLQRDLEATFKEDVSIYFDESIKDGLVETHQVHDSLSPKLKALVFIPIISQTYCDPKSFSWKNEFLTFKALASADEFGLKIKLSDGNVTSRILPVKIHELNSADKALLENEVGRLRSVDFIFKSPGVNRPLKPADPRNENTGHAFYRDQVNKIANAIKDVITGIQDSGKQFKGDEEKTEKTDVHPGTASILKKSKVAHTAPPTLMQEKKPIAVNLPGSIQTNFLEQVSKKMNSNVSFADELADILNVSRDSAYRRIRGETTLSFEEIKNLSNRFQISLDTLLGNSSDKVTFDSRMINRQTFPFDHWLGTILKSLEMIALFDRKEITWMAKDIPITHYFQFPELAAFKCYFWMKTILQYPEYAEKKYNERLIGDQLLSLTEKIWKKYALTPCTEIWSFEVVQITLQQIEHYLDCGLFEKPEDATKVCEQYRLFINHLEKELELGYKFDIHSPAKPGAPYKVYYNDIIVGDNTVLFAMDDNAVSYITANTFNLLWTSNPHFSEQTRQYFNNIISRSSLISGTSEKERSKIFNKFRTGIEKLLGKIRSS